MFLGYVFWIQEKKKTKKKNGKDCQFHGGTSAHDLLGSHGRVCKVLLQIQRPETAIKCPNTGPTGQDDTGGEDWSNGAN